MSVFRTTNTNSSPSRDPYPINRTAESDGPTERITGPKPRRNRVLFVLVLLTLFALTVAGVAIFFAWRAGEIARASLAQQHVVHVPESSGVAYAREPLRVQVGCAAVMYLDLDEPRANSAEPVSDLRYDSRCGDQPPRLTLGPGATAGAEVQDSDLDADGCARAIRTSPLGPGASVEVKKGAVLCVQTKTQMVLVEITEVGRTGTAGMRATSWEVTG
jgi:hypothetical protein